MRVQDPIVGKQTGRTGQLIFQSYYGRTYARSMPTIFHYPNTKKQQTCQSYFFNVQQQIDRIYGKVADNYSQEQRKNNNCYNMISSAVYYILDPYGKYTNKKQLKNFGLDNLNRVKPIVVELEITITADFINFRYNNQGYNSSIDFTPTKDIFILFNCTKYELEQTQKEYGDGWQTRTVRNLQNWEQSDRILVYMAIANENWFSNFNKLNS